MRALLPFVLAGLFSVAAWGQSPRTIAPQSVEVASGTLRLKAFLWKPAGPGPFPAVVFNHGRSYSPQQHTEKLTITEAAQILGPVFVKHGYVFLYLFRRGEGLSADQGAFIGDILQREEAAKGEEARKHLQFVLMTTDHLEDASAGLSFLKNLPEVDAHRVAVAGHSFGGQITLLEAERDPTICAAVTFGAAAGSWEGSAELRARLLAAVGKITVPVLLIHAANDYSVTAGKSMAEEFARLSKPHELKIYPPVGLTAGDGHNFVYTDVALWEDDVFQFLDQNVRRGTMRLVSHPIPLSSYILVFEAVSVVAIPLLLLGIRRVPRLKIVAKAWGCVLIIGLGLQVFAIGYERTITFPMRWSLEVPDEIRGEVKPVPGFVSQKVVVFSRPPLTEVSPGNHVCYQIIFSDALAERMQKLNRDVVVVQYDVTYRFDTPVFYHSPRLQGDYRNTTLGGMGYMSQGGGTSGFTCFPGPGLFK
jgi:carboxymethylenebutenolidase